MQPLEIQERVVPHLEVPIFGQLQLRGQGKIGAFRVHQDLLKSASLLHTEGLVTTGFSPQLEPHY